MCDFETSFSGVSCSETLHIGQKDNYIDSIELVECA
jgi:hypothetical protein